MRTFVALVALAALFAAPASAQLVALHFKDQKAANKLKDHLILFKGEYVLIGEPYQNVKFNAETNVLTRVPGKEVQLLVADPDDPSKVPYKWEGENRVVTAKRQIVGVPDSAVGQIDIFMREDSLGSLARVYAERRRDVDEAIAARDREPKGGAKWMTAHQKALSQMERLRSWLDSTMFPRAADKLEKEITRQRKNAAADAIAARGAEAKASVKLVPVPESLVAASQQISGGTDIFKMQESLHCRIIYRDFFNDARITALLEFAEEAIDGFRIDFVDPYLDEVYEDYISDHINSEWFFCPDDVAKQEQYYVVYYGRQWGEHKEEMLKVTGTRAMRSAAPEYLHYWRAGDDANLEGDVAHDIGHDLASMHFDKKRQIMAQDWLEEAVGFYIALEWFGHNDVSCHAFGDTTYIADKKKAGERSGQQGLRDWFNVLALEKGPKIDKLALTKLFQFSDADLAKSWSLFDFIAKKCGKDGQLWLRAGCTSSRTPATFISDWRAKSEEIWNITGEDVFAAIDAKWREYAETSQDTGDTKRK